MSPSVTTSTAGVSEGAVKRLKLSVPDLCKLPLSICKHIICQHVGVIINWFVFLYIADQPKLHQLQRLEGYGGKIIRVIDKTAAKWEELALALHFEGHILEIIHRDHILVVPACRNVLYRWLKGEARQPVNWITLIKSLREMELNTLGDELELALSADTHTWEHLTITIVHSILL